MTPEVLDAVVATVARIARPRRAVHFIWHGGEPLLMPRAFFEQILDAERRHCAGLCIDNCVQTNGTLLTADLVEYFARTGFAVSLSLDGPETLHDANRRDAAGRGSHARVLRAISRLRKARQLVGVVAVLTPENAERIGDIYRFMKRAGVQYRVNPIIAPEGGEHLQVSPAVYGRAMRELFDLWIEDPAPPHIDPIHLIVGNFLSADVWGCDFHAGCGRDVLAFNADGGVYPCGQLAGHPGFLLGNVLRDEAATILAAPVAKRIRRRRAQLKRGDCKGCSFFGICNGGCLASAWIRHGRIEAPDYFCSARRELFEYVGARIAERLVAAREETDVAR
jgi:uncharacterized protein